MPFPYREPSKKFEFGVLSLRVGRVLVAERDKDHWTYEVARKVKHYDGSVFGVLRQFECEGWVVRKCKLPSSKKSVARVIYQLTDDGICAITDALRPFQISPLST